MDRALLQSFTCAPPRVGRRDRPVEPEGWSRTVQTYLRHDALTDLGRGRPQQRLLLLFDGDNLVGVVAHYLPDPSCPSVRQLICIAVGLQWRGRSLGDGVPAVTWLARAVSLDLQSLGVEAPCRLVGFIDEGNVRSVGLARRLGARLLPEDGGYEVRVRLY